MSKTQNGSGCPRFKGSMRKLFFTAASKRPFSFQKWVQQAKKPTKASLIYQKRSRVPPGVASKNWVFGPNLGSPPERRISMLSADASSATAPPVVPPLWYRLRMRPSPPLKPLIHGNAKIAADFGLRATGKGQIGCWKRYSTCTGFPMTEHFSVMSVKPVQGCTGRVDMRKDTPTQALFTKSIPPGCLGEKKILANRTPVRLPTL